MRRHLIIGKFGRTDKFSAMPLSGETRTFLDFLGSDKKMNFGIGNALIDLAKLGIFPSEIGLDLIILAAHIQAADTHVCRDSESQDTWTREIRLFVPVSDLNKWNSAKPVIKQILDFLTGDIWFVNFRLRPISLDVYPKYKKLKKESVYSKFDYVSLFSGGLDSLIGAINSLENGDKPLLISHAGDGAASDAQYKCFNSLKQYYSKSKFNRFRVWMNFADFPILGKSLEHSTRGRSFLFFSLGVLAGTGLNKKFYLNVPENGLISLNIPLDPLRLGSHSTRTTHPFYVAKWNEMLKIIGINGIVQNPYWNMTKGEMVEKCSNQELLRLLVPMSISCSSPTKERWRGHGAQHCGYCLPCLIRRSALKRGLNSPDLTTYTLDNKSKSKLNTFKAEGRQVRSFQFAMNRLKSHKHFSKIAIYGAGPLSHESPDRIQELANMYERGMNEVDSFLKDIVAKPR